MGKGITVLYYNTYICIEQDKLITTTAAPTNKPDQPWPSLGGGALSPWVQFWAQPPGAPVAPGRAGAAMTPPRLQGALCTWAMAERGKRGFLCRASGAAGPGALRTVQGPQNEHWSGRGEHSWSAQLSVAKTLCCGRSGVVPWCWVAVQQRPRGSGREQGGWAGSRCHGQLGAMAGPGAGLGTASGPLGGQQTPGTARTGFGLPRKQRG